MSSSLFIYKYPFPVTDHITIMMPAGAKILTVQTQQHGNDSMNKDGEQGCIWALVAPDAIPGPREFRLVGTGHPIDPEEAEYLDYIGTFQMLEGKLVFHLFEIIKI